MKSLKSRCSHISRIPLNPLSSTAPSQIRRSIQHETACSACQQLKDQINEFSQHILFFSHTNNSLIQRKQTFKFERISIILLIRTESLQQQSQLGCLHIFFSCFLQTVEFFYIYMRKIFMFIERMPRYSYILCYIHLSIREKFVLLGKRKEKYPNFTPSSKVLFLIELSHFCELIQLQ